MTDYDTNLFGEEVPQVEEEETVSAAIAGNPFNIFAFTDTIAARNKKDAWVLYQKALASDMAAEEIFFKVVWLFKTLLLASRTATAEEADMKEYPFKKAKGSLRNFKPGELEQMSADLVAGYHEARRGKGEIETLIEKLLLRL
ncbi:MAG: hypothetical protein JWL80_143 [Parcubacteria group bacterium]|nr:hypothetical protein [Parcubacteria group bacterium]